MQMRAEKAQALRQQMNNLASRHGFGPDAAESMWDAVVLGSGRMAQFSHPEFGGSGQWMRGGMLMIGDMFNRSLQSRVGAFCDELAQLYAAHPEWVPEEASKQSAAGGAWWPKELATPSTSGSQNGMRYAYFPEQCRLAIERAGAVEVYDTDDHVIGGVSQQQGTNDSLVFTSQRGFVDLTSLKRIDERRAPPTSVATAPSGPRAPSIADAAHEVHQHHHDHQKILDTLEKLAGLCQRGVLTEAEFLAKKTELLRRL